MAQNLRPIGNHRCIGHGKYKGPFLDPMTGLIIHMEHMEDVKQRYPQIHQQLSSITAGGRPTQPSCTRRNSWVTGTKHWTSHPVADGWCIGEFRGAKKVSGSLGYPRYHLNFGRSTNRAQEFLVLNVLKGSSEELGLIVGRSRENWPNISPTKKGI